MSTLYTLRDKVTIISPSADNAFKCTVFYGKIRCLDNMHIEVGQFTRNTHSPTCNPQHCYVIPNWNRMYETSPIVFNRVQVEDEMCWYNEQLKLTLHKYCKFHHHIFASDKI